MRLRCSTLIALALLATPGTFFSDRLLCNAQEHSQQHDGQQREQHQQHEQHHHEHQQQQNQEHHRGQHQQAAHATEEVDHAQHDRPVHVEQQVDSDDTIEHHHQEPPQAEQRSEEDGDQIRMDQAQIQAEENGPADETGTENGSFSDHDNLMHPSEVPADQVHQSREDLDVQQQIEEHVHNSINPDQNDERDEQATPESSQYVGTHEHENHAAEPLREEYIVEDHNTNTGNAPEFSEAPREQHPNPAETVEAVQNREQVEVEDIQRHDQTADSEQQDNKGGRPRDFAAENLAQEEHPQAAENESPPDSERVEDPNINDNSQKQTETSDSLDQQQTVPLEDQEASPESTQIDEPQAQTNGDSVDEMTSSQETVTAQDPPPVDDDYLYISDDEPLSTPQSERKPGKEGSLKSFFDKVKDQEQNQNLSGQTTGRPDKEAPPKKQSTTSQKQPEAQTTTTSQTPPEAQSTPSQKEDKLKKLEEAAAAKDYTGAWGTSAVGNNRYADLEILGLLFHKDLVDSPDSRYNKVFEPVGDLVIPSLYASIMGGDETDSSGEEAVLIADDPTGPLPGIKGKRSVNSEFVEGLDDIDKLFEDVDPPDEFDVGASGTSIQDVLMGQTTKIIVKRVKIGAHYVSRTVKVVKTRVTAYFADKDRQWPKIKFDKVQLVHAKQWITAHGKLVFEKSKEFFDSIFGDDDELDGDEFKDYANDLKKRMNDMTGSK